MTRTLRSVTLLTLLLSAGCATTPAATAPATEQHSPPAPANETQDVVAAPEATMAPAVGSESGLEPADTSAFAGCAGPVEDGAPRTVDIAGRKATQRGSHLRFDAADADGALVLGVLGPINEDSPANLAALQRYLAFFAEQTVDAIVVTGDSGETSAGITRALEVLTSATVPVLVVSGNRECREDYFDGVAAAQRRSSAIVNLNVIRSVELGGVTVVSLPGYHDADFITCESGCRYTRANVDEVIRLARAAAGPVVLVSHGPPRGTTREAIDYAINGGNAGDPELNRAIEQGRIAFGLFSNIKEAGARATDLTGTTRVPPDRPVRSLFLNPGPADTESWEMNDGSRSRGYATVLEIKGGQARWKLFVAPQPGALQKRNAP